MSEDEFKKRLSRMYHQTEALYDKDVDKLLDEARNEFHSIIEEIEFNSEPEQHIDGLYAKMVLKRLRDFETKYFGEAKKHEAENHG